MLSICKYYIYDSHIFNISIKNNNKRKQINPHILFICENETKQKKKKNINISWIKRVCLYRHYMTEHMFRHDIHS